MRDQLAANETALQIRSAPNSLASERLLVFELTGGVYKFEKAVRLIDGLEFLGSEDLEEDAEDANPTVYLMVPSEGALKNIESLWRGWQETQTVPPGFSTWKTMLGQLRDIRPWGPQDRVTAGDLEVLQAEIASGAATIRVEIELVFRREFLNETLFSSLAVAREQIRAWQHDDNHHRPHLSLGNIPPIEFVEKKELEMRAA